LAGSPRAPAPSGTAQVARTERNSSEGKPGAKAAAKTKSAPNGPNKPAPAAKPSERNGPSEAAREQVIADATRLVQWGRKWYELAELIASMADRPHLTDVRRILKDNKAVIDKKAGRG
jgi:hypothetical protein